MGIKYEEMDGGFTFVELLVGLVMLGVLASLAIEAYIVFREDAYHQMAQQIMGQARTSIEAGKIDSESFSGALLADQTAPGPLVNGDGATIAPGLMLPNDFRVYVYHNPSCTSPICLEDYVISRHCKADQRVVYWKLHQLTEFADYNAAVTGPCS